VPSRYYSKQRSTSSISTLVSLALEIFAKEFATERSIARIHGQESQNGSIEYGICICVRRNISRITTTRYVRNATILLRDHG
jgi:hypothetical protein